MNRSQDLARNDQIFFSSRVVFAAVVLVLGMGVWVLYVQPDDTWQQLFWMIKPRMTALALGTGYLMGMFFFARAFTATKWHYVASGLLPITAFSIGMLLQTVVHLDRFNLNHPSFWIWTIIYIVAPIVVPIVWLRNRRTDPGVPDPNDIIVSEKVRLIARVGGGLLVVAAIAIFVFPDLIIPLWPWQLTPLSARSLAPWAVLFGGGGVSLSLEPRWSGWRVPVETFWVAIVFMLIAVVRDWSDLDPSKVTTWLFVIALALGALVLPLVYAAIELPRRRRLVSEGKPT